MNNLIVGICFICWVAGLFGLPVLINWLEVKLYGRATGCPYPLYKTPKVKLPQARVIK